MLQVNKHFDLVTNVDMEGRSLEILMQIPLHQYYLIYTSSRSNIMTTYDDAKYNNERQTHSIKLQKKSAI